MVIQFQQPRWLIFLDVDDSLPYTIITRGLTINLWPTEGFLQQLEHWAIEKRNIPKTWHLKRTWFIAKAS